MPSDYEKKLSNRKYPSLITYSLTLGGGEGAAAAEESGRETTSVDLYIIIVRLIHILGMVVWLGSGIFTIAFLQPR